MLEALGWVCIGWAACFAISGTLIASFWYKDLHDYNHSRIAVFALLPIIAPPIGLVVWMSAGFPKLRLDWLYGTPEEHKTLPLRGLHRLAICYGMASIGYCLIAAQFLFFTSNWFSFLLELSVAIWFPFLFYSVWVKVGIERKLGTSFTTTVQNIGWASHYLIPSDPEYPNTFGWRSWFWSPDLKLLKSPQRGNVWNDSELRVEEWDESSVLRGCAGIHAHLVPPRWEEKESEFEGCRSSIITVNLGKVQGQYVVHPGQTIIMGGVTYTIGPGGQLFPFGTTFEDEVIITGIVERFSKYVLGTEGWRAEWAIIRELRAPNNEIGLALEKAYPDVAIIYPKEKLKWKSEK